MLSYQELYWCTWYRTPAVNGSIGSIRYPYTAPQASGGVEDDYSITACVYVTLYYLPGGVQSGVHAVVALLL